MLSLNLPQSGLVVNTHTENGRGRQRKSKVQDLELLLLVWHQDVQLLAKSISYPFHRLVLVPKSAIKILKPNMALFCPIDLIITSPTFVLAYYCLFYY